LNNCNNESGLYLPKKIKDLYISFFINDINTSFIPKYFDDDGLYFKKSFNPFIFLFAFSVNKNLCSPLKKY